MLANTKLVFASGEETAEIRTTLGTPQGDSLSPILFTIYLEAALRELRPKLKNLNLPTNELAYADDVDFIFSTLRAARDQIPIISSTLKKYNLKVNETKTELTNVKRNTHDWKGVRKLGSLINEKEDIIKRRNLAQIAYNDLEKMWKNKIIPESLKLHLYDTLITPILMYNCGTWGLTTKNLESIDTLHRRQLRRTIGIKWPDKITNEDLYERCRTKPISDKIVEQRWQLFGHILRRDENIPAQVAMTEYFQCTSTKNVGRPPTSLPITLNQDLKNLVRSGLNTSKKSEFTIEPKPTKLTETKDLELLRAVAQDRDIWKEFTSRICRAYHKFKKD